MNDEMIDEFKIEAAEMFESAEEGFLNIDRGEDFISNFNLIFRSFHSLKGAAGMFGLMDLQAHMHKLESLFEAQKPKGSMGKSQIDYFLSGIDVAKALLDGQDTPFTHLSEAELDNIDQAEMKTTTPPKTTNHASETVLKSGSNKGHKRGTIFIVDDEESILEILETYILDLDFEVITFTSAQEALNSLNDNSPDVILSDISMPGMDGIEFVKKVREVNLQVSFIMVSGQITKDRILELLKYDVFGFIEKPFQENVIKEVTERAYTNSQLSYLLQKSINYILYQFSDLDQFLKESGKENMRVSLKNELKSIINIQKDLYEKKKTQK
jgi:FixJ family two-component response regulator/HPt (histidine-containing phosphotransfer) domain-containing protein